MKKTWLKTLVAGLFLSFAMGSCMVNNATDIDDDVDGGNVKGEEETAYFSLNVGTNSISSLRAGSNEDDGIAIERKVNHVRVVLYDPVDEVVMYRFDLDASNGTGSANFSGDDVVSAKSPVASRFVMSAKKVVKQDYDMLVLINSPQYVKNITEKGCSKLLIQDYATFNDLTPVIGVSSGIYSTSATYSFFMSNFKNFARVRETHDLYTDASDAEDYPVEVLMDRAVAKVMVDDSDLEIRNGADFKNVTWRLDITNKKSYWIRRYAPILGGVTAEVNSHTDREILYAEDPNFKDFSNFRSGLTIPNLTNEFNYMSSPNVTISTGTSNWEYVLENTMEAADQYEDVTTRVLIKGNYIPSGFSQGQSYFTYKGLAISTTDMASYATTPANIPSLYIGLANAISAFVSGAGKSLTNPTASFSDAASGINYYHQGINHYSVLVRHFNDNQVATLMAYGRYGVVRNNVYKVNLKTLSGFGTPDVPGPEGPNDKDEKWMSADIQIQPWYIREQNVENL